MPNIKLSDKITDIMKAQGFTQASLAKFVGVSQGTIWKIMTGKSQRSKYLPDIAKALGVSVSELISSGESTESINKNQAIHKEIECVLGGMSKEDLNKVLKYSNNLRQNRELENDANQQDD